MNDLRSVIIPPPSVSYLKMEIETKSNLWMPPSEVKLVIKATRYDRFLLKGHCKKVENMDLIMTLPSLKCEVI